MRMSVAGHWLAVSSLALLAACGGGGGGDSAPPSPKLSFMPASYAENVQYGQVGTGTVTAVVANPDAISGTLYIQVTGTDGVFSTDWSLAQVDGTHYGVTLHSLPALAAGHHTGRITVTLCKDAACQTPYPGASAALPYDIDVEPSPLHAVPQATTESTVHWGGSDPDVVPVVVAGDALPWTATTTASWLRLDIASGTGATNVNVRFVPTTALGVGDYTDDVTFSSSDGQTVKVPFTLHVLPAAFQLVGGVPSFNAINGAPIAPQDLVFDIDSGAPTPWTLSSDAAWLSTTPANGVTPGRATLQPDPSIGPLASGSHLANLLLGDGTNTNVTTQSLSSSLTLVKPTLSTSVPAVTLGGTLGRDLSAQTLSLWLNTDVNAFAWRTSGVPSWLATSNSGSVSQAGATLSMAPASSGASPGSTSAVVTYSATVNGDTVTTPVTVNFNRDQRRLLPSTWGVGLASSPTGTVLSRTITMRDNFGGNVAWTAVSDKPWLAVTPSGDTGGANSLALTANPASLADGAIDVAKVTVSASGGVAAAATVRVGLYRSSTGLAATTLIPSGNFTHMVADRVRPRIYAVDGSATVYVYDAYTASQVATVTNVGQRLVQAAVSPDGSRLFVLDWSAAVKVIDLDTLTVIASWPVSGYLGNASYLSAVRPNGVDVLLVNDGMYQGKAYVEGRFVGDVSPLGAVGILGRMAATDDGSRVYASPTYSPTLLMPSDLDYTAVSGGTIVWSQSPLYTSGFGGSLAVSGDGSALYAGAPGGCERLSTTDLSPIALLPGGIVSPSDIAVTWDGRVACSFAQFSYMTGPDVVLYSATGATLGTYSVSQNMGNGVRWSVATPDGLVLVAFSPEGRLGFIPIGR